MALNALPVYCFNVSQFANNILSQAFIGHLGAKQLAASALAISYMNVCCQTINYGLATGQETVVSQANGARRFREVGVCLKRGLIVLFVSQFIMSCVSYFGEEILVGLGQDAALAQAATGLGNNQEFLKKVVESVTEGFELHLAQSMSAAQEHLKLLESRAQVMEEEIKQLHAAAARSTQVPRAQGAVGAPPALGGS